MFEIPPSNPIHTDWSSCESRDGSSGTGDKRKQVEDREKLVEEPGGGTKSASKRALQNREAQRAFRERKEKYIKSLEAKVRDMDSVTRQSTALEQRSQQIEYHVQQLSREKDILLKERELWVQERTESWRQVELMRTDMISLQEENQRLRKLTMSLWEDVSKSKSSDDSSGLNPLDTIPVATVVLPPSPTIPQPIQKPRLVNTPESVSSSSGHHNPLRARRGSELPNGWESSNSPHIGREAPLYIPITGSIATKSTPFPHSSTAERSITPVSTPSSSPEQTPLYSKDATEVKKTPSQ